MLPEKKLLSVPISYVLSAIPTVFVSNVGE